MCKALITRYWRRSCRWVAVGVATIVFASIAALPVQAFPPSSFFRDGVPDFDQQKAGREDGGDYHCAPTAAANSFTWFDKQGYDIVPDAWDDDNGGDHNGLIDRLATDSKTNRIPNPNFGDPGEPEFFKGTSRDNYVKGLRRYLRSANNNSLNQFDVKFQGSGYNGYSVGSHGDTATLNWIKSEIASGEDVMLHIGWYLETSPGVLGPRQGGHVVTLDGYTSDNKLLIRDPFYPEGIIEPDSDLGAADLIYVYSTAGDVRLRAKIEAATTASPKPFVWDGLVRPLDYALVTTTDPLLQESFVSVYSDYVSIGLDLVAVQAPILPSNPSSILIHPQLPPSATTAEGYLIQFDNENTPIPIQLVQLNLAGETPQVIGWEGEFDNTEKEFQVLSSFAPSGSEETSHSQVQLFIDREVFGEFAVDSFFDIWTEVALDSGSWWDQFSFELNAQTLFDPDAGGMVDPLDFADYLPPTTDAGILLAEIDARNAAIAAIPEPSAVLLLMLGFPGLALCLCRRGRVRCYRSEGESPSPIWVLHDGVGDRDAIHAAPH